MLEIEHPVMCLATMPHVYAACPVHVTILVLVVNSDQFQIYRVTRFYSSAHFYVLLHLHINVYIMCLLIILFKTYLCHCIGVC